MQAGQISIHMASDTDERKRLATSCMVHEEPCLVSNVNPRAKQHMRPVLQDSGHLDRKNCKAVDAFDSSHHGGDSC